jgi:hypothetical protein
MGNKRKLYRVFLFKRENDWFEIEAESLDEAWDKAKAPSDWEIEDIEEATDGE